jgi:cytochrome c oxidase assembly factor CtaG
VGLEAGVLHPPPRDVGLVIAPLVAHGDRVPVSELRGAWEAAPLVLLAVGVSLALFVQAFVRLRRRGRPDLAPWTRAALFGTAVVLGTLALVSPLDAVGEEYLLSAHMLQHVIVGDAAPALAVAAVRGPLVFFLLPAAALRVVAGAGPLRAVLHELGRPFVAFAVWAVVMGGWHVPAAYDYALTHQWAHNLEHASFAVAGVLVWNQLIDPAGRRTLTPAGRLAFLAVVFWAGQVLADVLLFSFSPLYPAYAAQDERLFGISPLTDQRLAGVVMMVEQVIALGICAVFLFRLLRRERHPETGRPLLAPGP